MTGAILHFVQQAFDQVPVVGDAHGYGLLLWTKGVHRLGPAKVAKRSEALSAGVVALACIGAATD